MARRPALSTIRNVCALAIGATLATMGCSSKEDPPATASVDFRGVYRPASAGNIGAIAFTEDHHYMLMSGSCREQSCAEVGTYAYDSAKGVLALTDAKTKGTRTLPVKVLATAGLVGSAGLASQGLRPATQELVNTNQETVTRDNQLADGGNQLVEFGKALIELIKSAMMDGQQMDKDEDKKDDSGDQGDNGNGGGDQGDQGDGDHADPADAGAAGGAASQDCSVGIPNGDTSLEDAAKYWARCPRGS